MTAYDQPDLFGEYDAHQERRRLWNEPMDCPACGAHLPNGVLKANHGLPDRYHDRCRSQRIRRNNLRWAALHKPEELPRYIERAQAARLDPDAILRELAAEHETTA